MCSWPTHRADSQHSQRFENQPGMATSAATPWYAKLRAADAASRCLLSLGTGRRATCSLQTVLLLVTQFAPDQTLQCATEQTRPIRNPFLRDSKARESSTSLCGLVEVLRIPSVLFEPKECCPATPAPFNRKCLLTGVTGPAAIIHIGSVESSWGQVCTSTVGGVIKAIRPYMDQGSL